MRRPSVLAGSMETKRVGKDIDGDALDGVSGGWSVPLRWLTPNANATLESIDRGQVTPDPSSRLGAYAATANYPEGTVGYAVHNSIGDIYRTLGTVGEEKIGNVFHSPEAQSLYGHSVQSDASRQIADIEYKYWNDVRAENPLSIGGNLGSAVPPAARDYIQQHIEGGRPEVAADMPTSSIDPNSLPHDPNLPDTTPQDLYGMNSALGGDTGRSADVNQSVQNYENALPQNETVNQPVENYDNSPPQGESTYTGEE